MRGGVRQTTGHPATLVVNGARLTRQRFPHGTVWHIRPSATPNVRVSHRGSQTTIIDCLVAGEGWLLAVSVRTRARISNICVGRRRRTNIEW